MGTKRKGLSRRVFVALATSGATLLAAELVLRFLPVNQGLGVRAVNAEQPVLRFAPRRASTWSKGPRFSIVNEVRTNGAGFVHDEEYVTDDPGPLLAVVGDSYVEAAMVPFGETLVGRLAHAEAARGRVYAFAASGAGFSQYLVWAEHARDTYAPDAFAFVVIANDFSDSLTRKAGQHHFRREENGAAELVRVDYRPSWLRNLLRRSSLAMYLATNVDVAGVLRGNGETAPAERFVGNIPARMSAEERDDYAWVLESFLAALPAATGVGPERIVLVLDGLRPELYDAELLASAEGSAWWELRGLFEREARPRGYEVVDLQPAFVRELERSGGPFEFAEDNHWSAAGHAVAAAALGASSVVTELFRQDGSPTGPPAR